MSWDVISRNQGFRWEQIHTIFPSFKTHHPDWETKPSGSLIHSPNSSATKQAESSTRRTNSNNRSASRTSEFTQANKQTPVKSTRLRKRRTWAGGEDVPRTPSASSPQASGSFTTRAHPLLQWWPEEGTVAVQGWGAGGEGGPSPASGWLAPTTGLAVICTKRGGEGEGRAPEVPHRATRVQ